jgi:hypothetical protein
MVEVRRQIIRYNGDDSAQDWTVVIVSSTGSGGSVRLLYYKEGTIQTLMCISMRNSYMETAPVPLQ